MKVNSKKLLSWLCVIAMVLSLAPVMDLSNFAVETNAAAGDTNWTAAGITNPAGNSINNTDAYFTGTCLANGYCPVCGEGVTWEEWNSTTLAGNKAFGALTNKRHFYFNDEITALNYYVSTSATSTGSVCIWLKSSTNLSVASSVYIRAGGGATFNFFGEGSITDTNGGAFLDIRGGSTMNLYGGNFVYKNVADSYTNGAITFFTGGGTLNIYNGATIGPALNDNGTPDDTSDDYQDTSNVYMNVYYGAATYPGTINMYGGTIQNGVGPADGTCGNVNVRNRGTFNMYGGTIKGGTYLASATDTKGGNIYTGTNATVKIYGGTIDGGRAATGGNIYVNSGTTTLSIYGGTIKNGVSTGDGGNIHTKAAASSHVYFYGGTITGGDAGGYGGNVYAYTNFTMSETPSWNIPTIMSNGDADKGGGNLYMRLNAADSDVTFAINGGTIEGGEHTGTSGSGGNVYLRDGTCTMTGGTITGGVAPSSGGNVYVTENGGTFDMQGGVISRGSNAAGAKTRTANVQVNDGGTFTLKEGVRLENQATLVDKDGYEALYTTDADALAAYGNNTVYMTLAKDAVALDKDVVINTYGYDVALSGSGNVQLIDTANHDFETASGKVTVSGGVSIADNDVTVNDKRYITVKDGEAYSAHYIKMGLTGIALRTNEDGLYYAGEFQCDNTLADCVEQFGIAVSAGDTMPTNLNGKYSIYDGANFTPNEEHVVTAYGVSVFGILKEVGTDGRDGATNLAYLQMQVNANPYLKINTGDETITIMACEDSTANKFGSKTLLDVVETINGKWDEDYKNALIADNKENAVTGMLEFKAKWTNADKMGAEGVATMVAATGNIA